MPRNLPPGVQAFVTECLSSITQLDLLLLLHASPDHAFSASELSRHLRIPERFVTGQLVDLSAAGVVAAVDGDEPAWRFAATGPRARDVDALAEAVGKRKRAVHNLILSGPSDDVQLFSDAFRVRKREKD